MMIMILLLAAAASPENPPSRPTVPFSLFLCRADDLPTVTLDHHDDHRAVEYAQFGQNELSFVLIDPEFTVIEQPPGDGGGWRVVARGPARQAVGMPDGVPAAVEVTIRVGDQDGPSYSYVVGAGDWERSESDCQSPRPPLVHLAERIR